MFAETYYLSLFLSFYAADGQRALVRDELPYAGGRGGERPGPAPRDSAGLPCQAAESDLQVLARGQSEEALLPRDCERVPVLASGPLNL